MNPPDALDQLGAVWSPSFDAYALGRIDVSQTQCLMCRHAPCGSPKPSPLRVGIFL